MIVPETISEKLLFSTVRIVVETQSGLQGTGTGFCYDFPLDGNNRLPLIITNKHVVKDAQKGTFHLHESAVVDGKSVPSGRFFPVSLGDFESSWIGHPNEGIDLCGMLFQPIRTRAAELGKNVFTIDIGNEVIWSDEDLANLSAAEDVVMVGYPIGLWDEYNNLPIFRRGITASHPAIDFLGKSEGVIDIAAFPGSSGSPVLVLNESGIYHDKKRRTNVVGHRVIFLGVLYAGPQMNAEGEIVIREIPLSRQVVASVPVMINLGYIVKAKEVVRLGEHIANELRKRGALP